MTIRFLIFPSFLIFVRRPCRHLLPFAFTSLPVDFKLLHE